MKAQNVKSVGSNRRNLGPGSRRQNNNYRPDPWEKASSHFNESRASYCPPRLCNPMAHGPAFWILELPQLSENDLKFPTTSPPAPCSDPSILLNDDEQAIKLEPMNQMPIEEESNIIIGECEEDALSAISTDDEKMLPSDEELISSSPLSYIYHHNNS